MLTRREALYGLGTSLGSVAFSALLAADEERPAGPLAPKPPHAPARAKACIFLMMEGGPSHIDTFDPKPKLADLHLKEFTRTDKMQSAMSGGKRYYVASPFKFAQGGASPGRTWRRTGSTSPGSPTTCASTAAVRWTRSTTRRPCTR